MGIDYTDGPADQPWEVEKDGDYAYIQRHGYDLRLKPEPLYTIFLANHDTLETCQKIAARLNRLDSALRGLCEAVAATWTVMDTTPADVCDRLYLASYEAAQAAREVLNGD